MTLPALMQEVHTFKRFGVLPTMARTVWMFGFQRRLVRTCECEIEWPKPGPLPQTSQLAATVLVLTVDGFMRVPRIRQGQTSFPSRPRLQAAGR